MSRSADLPTERLPEFRYHPDPVATGSVRSTSGPCVVCEQVRGFEYAGPIFGSEDPGGSVCPWCIADGSATELFGISFDGGDGSLGIAPEIVDELTTRTPGFLSWQESYWEYHCEDACAYLGRVGSEELAGLSESASLAVKRALEPWAQTDASRATLFTTLRADGNLSCYLFHCVRCGEFAAHCDAA